MLGVCYFFCMEVLSTVGYSRTAELQPFAMALASHHCKSCVTIALEQPLDNWTNFAAVLASVLVLVAQTSGSCSFYTVLILVQITYSE